MAKAAKQVEADISDKSATKFVKDILERYEAIESARAKFMSQARRERERMQTVYEDMAAKGVSQKAAKTNIKIVRALEKIKGWMTDLDAEDAKMAQKLAKAQKDKKQLMLFGELPKQVKPKRFVEQLREQTTGDLQRAEAQGSA